MPMKLQRNSIDALIFEKIKLQLTFRIFLGTATNGLNQS